MSTPKIFKFSENCPQELLNITALLYSIQEELRIQRGFILEKERYELGMTSKDDYEYYIRRASEQYRKMMEG